MSRYPVCFRLSRRNRNSVAAVLAVLEAELPRDLIDLQLARSPPELPSEGLAVFSFMTPAKDEVEREVRQLRATHPGLRLLAGGSHPSADPAGTLAMGFDFVSPGEAGLTVVRLVEALARGSSVPSPILPVDAPSPLDRWGPWPASGMLFAEIEITRGCRLSCTFCQTPRLMGRTLRHRSLEKLRPVFEHAVSTGHRYTRFITPNSFAYGAKSDAVPNPEAVEALLRTAREAGFEQVYFGTFPSEVRPESVTEEMLELVRRYCDNDTIALGIQSGSDAVLRRLKRGHTAGQGLEAVARIARAGFTPKVDFIFGLPEETSADQASTCDLIERLAAEYGAVVHAHIFTPLPGTPLAYATPSPLDDRTRALIDRLASDERLSGSHPALLARTSTAS